MFNLLEDHGTVVFINKTRTWHDAQKYCIENHGNGLVNLGTLQRENSSIPVCAKTSLSYWVDDVLIKTQFIALNGK